MPPSLFMTTPDTLKKRRGGDVDQVKKTVMHSKSNKLKWTLSFSSQGQ